MPCCESEDPVENDGEVRRAFGHFFLKVSMRVAHVDPACAVDEVVVEETGFVLVVYWPAHGEGGVWGEGCA